MRFRITQTMIVEYEVNPKYYTKEGTNKLITDPQAMLEIDLEGFRRDPVEMYSQIDEETITNGQGSIEVKGEILDA